MSKILTVYNWGSKLKKSFDGSDVILTTLAKFRLQKKMASHNKEITTETKHMILRLKREGYVHRKIAEIIGRDHSSIIKFLKHYDGRNSVENKPKTGRNMLVMERGDRIILRSVKVNRRATLRDLTNIVNERLPRPVSTRTVRRRLKCHGYTRRRVRKTLTVSLKNRKIV
jgi:transposase